MSRRMMRTLGAGLMEAGNQVQIARREELERQKEANMLAIAEGRLGIEKERNEMMRENTEAQSTERRQIRQQNAIEHEQERLDAMREPGDGYLDEYVQARALVIKNSVDMTPEEVQGQLKAHEDAYKAARLAEMEPGTAEYNERQKEVDRYTQQVNRFVDTANRKLSNTFGDDWTGDIGDYLHFTPAGVAAREGGLMDMGPDYGPDVAPAPEAEGPGWWDRATAPLGESTVVPGESSKLFRDRGLFDIRNIGLATDAASNILYGGPRAQRMFKGLSETGDFIRKLTVGSDKPWFPERPKLDFWTGQPKAPSVPDPDVPPPDNRNYR